MLLLSGSSPAQDSPAQRHGPQFGTFSDLHRVEETGDLLGIEITVLPFYRTAYVIIQYGQGVRAWRSNAGAGVTKTHIHFKVESGPPDVGSPCTGEFSAVVTPGGIKLRVGELDAGFLPRRRSYWAR